MTVFFVLASMIAGIGLGYLMRRRTGFLRFWDKISGWTVFVLLFLLGLSVGSSEIIFSSLGTAGVTALWLSAGALIGSLIPAFLLQRILFPKKEK